MISTSSYKNSNSNEFTKIDILNTKLAFKKEMTKGDSRYYIQEYYDKVLAHLDPLSTYKEFNNSILISKEESNDLSTRHIIASWFELMLGIDVPEVIINEEKVIIIKRPEYIKNILNEIINASESEHLKKEGNIQIKFYFQ